MNTEPQAAARRLVEQAAQVSMLGHEPWRRIVQWVSRGRLGQHRAGVVPEKLDRSTAPWQDTPCWERGGWRTRKAYLDDEDVFSVDYRTCLRCSLAWVEWPYTFPQYQRCGLASAGFAALRAENPGMAWHTMSNHGHDSREFWNAVGVDVPGGYRQQDLCQHVTAG